MTCSSAKRDSTPYVDGKLRAIERSRIALHLRQCDACSSYFDQMSSLRAGLQQLSTPVAPRMLKTRLRILASRERLYNTGSPLQFMWQRWKFRLHEFMRPLTIPATGGLLSSVALFATLALSIGQTVRAVAYEVPVLNSDRTDANLISVDMRSSIVLTMDFHDVPAVEQRHRSLAGIVVISRGATEMNPASVDRPATIVHVVF